VTSNRTDVESNRMDVERAAAWLLEHMDDGEADGPLNAAQVQMIAHMYGMHPTLSRGVRARRAAVVLTGCRCRAIGPRHAAAAAASGDGRSGGRN
jgi:hypothetical protein